MKIRPALFLLLSCAACSQEKAPVEEVAAAAEKIVAPSAQPTPLANGPWAPQDTCTKVEGAAEFRQRLGAAVEARDAGALVALAADDVRLDFGGGAGKAELRARLDDEALGLWDELVALMELGCSANKQGGITIPWYFDQDLGNVDPFEAMIVTGEEVPVLQRADAASRPVARISWDLVSLAAPVTDEAFQQVELADGTTGFIATDRLRSVVDYRLIASSRNGRWRITSFVAGD